ncbi:low temperature-induced protein lt101.2 [Phragmites australis]|uniref:low temperature-induced protein lt101.2 n=1 Tax=Phragmites australis TaxID=29695 RepID=UPI002D797249|nr:low temperature-induced protein lt101.2 [Phragmites australis]
MRSLSSTCYLIVPRRRRRKKKRRKKEAAMGSETFLEILLAILLPPVGVFLRYGIGAEFWICLLLTILGYIPGIIYAVYVLVA